ncbi:MAG: DUF2911 domain-containing protein [Ferruginibacter sp.]
MKNVIITAAFAVSAIAGNSQVKMPQPSPTQTIKQDFAMGNIELKYSRPAAKERKVFGDLVPYGKMWRTGANAATILKFSDPVEIMGKKVDSGTYALYTIPGEDSWEVILNKGITNWGTTGYKESEDVIRFKTEAVKIKNAMENFTMQFDNIKPESLDLWVMWEKTGIKIPITANIKDKIRSQVEAAMMGDKKPYWQAAQFYNEYDKNYAKALENINKGTEETPKAYWMYLYKARIQKQMGDVAGARASSMKSMEIAKAEKNDDYVKLNADFMKELK